MIYDVAIVGGGPAGALAATLLSRHGHKVVLIEKNSSPVRKVCGEYLCPQGVKLLNKLGLESTLEGTREINGMRIVTPQGADVQSRFPRGAGRAVNRRHFDEALLKMAKSSAEVREGVRLIDFKRTDDQWHLHTSRGPIEARFLIGADGRSSVLSKNLNNDLPVTAKRVAVHVFVHSDEPNDNFGEMHLFKDGSYIGVDPTGPHEVNLSLVSEAATIRTVGGPGRALFHYVNQSKDLRERFTVSLTGVKPATVFPIQHRTKSVCPAPNLALVGDAAGFVDPLTGEGIFNALLSAELLSTALVDNFDTAIQNYQRSYVKHLRGKIRLNKVFQVMLRQPWLVEQVAGFLLRAPERADTFIGIVGNVYSPREGLARLLF